MKQVRIFQFVKDGAPSHTFVMAHVISVEGVTKVDGGKGAFTIFTVSMAHRFVFDTYTLAMSQHKDFTTALASYWESTSLEQADWR